MGTWYWNRFSSSPQKVAQYGRALRLLHFCLWTDCYSRKLRKGNFQRHCQDLQLLDSRLVEGGTFEKLHTSNTPTTCPRLTRLLPYRSKKSNAIKLFLNLICRFLKSLYF